MAVMARQLGLEPALERHPPAADRTLTYLVGAGRPPAPTLTLTGTGTNGTDGSATDPMTLL